MKNKNVVLFWNSQMWGTYRRGMAPPSTKESVKPDLIKNSLATNQKDILTQIINLFKKIFQWIVSKLKRKSEAAEWLHQEPQAFKIQLQKSPKNLPQKQAAKKHDSKIIEDFTCLKPV